MRRFSIIPTEPVVKAVNLNRSYRMGTHTLDALKNVNISVENGAFMGIAGPSGSGKTSLLNLLGCIDRPNSGDVIVQGIPTRFLDENQLADFRARKIGFIFQTFNLIPTLTALENVEYPLLILGMKRKECFEHAMKALTTVGLEKHAKHKPNQLSGGQRQRVAIARAVVKKPSMVLADEPTANLDRKTATEILDLLQNLNQKDGTTFIFSTHDQHVLERMQRVVQISEGVILPPPAITEEIEFDERELRLVA